MQYNPDHLAIKPVLKQADKAMLVDMAAAYPLIKFRSEVRNYEELMVDFVYTSAKIEGNTYDRVDTDNLLRLGITAGGKKHSDAIMLVNLRVGFDHVMQADRKNALDLNYVGSLHGVLMRDLLPVHEQGLVRQSSVLIGATTYRPLADADRLSTEMRFLLASAEKIEDGFERAIYLHCNLAYLQYFRDGNKRTARLVQTACLVQHDLLPLFFADSLIDVYRRATVHYYETGDYAPYVDFFKANYRLVVNSLSGISFSEA